MRTLWMRWMQKRRRLCELVCQHLELIHIYQLIELSSDSLHGYLPDGATYSIRDYRVTFEEKEESGQFTFDVLKDNPSLSELRNFLLWECALDYPLSSVQQKMCEDEALFELMYERIARENGAQKSPYNRRLNRRPDFSAKYRLYSPEEGGRALTAQGYRGDLGYADASPDDCIYMIYHEFLTEEKEVVPWGVVEPVALEGNAFLWVVCDKAREYHHNRMQPGQRYFIQEGARAVGEGVVLQLFGMNS